MEQNINCQQQQQFKIGLVTFNSKKMDQDKLTLMNFNKMHQLLSQWYGKERYIRQLGRQSFYILFQFKMITHNNIVKYIQKWQSLSIQLSNIRQLNQPIPTNYLNQIAHINFNRLMSLGITFCRLRNIQALGFLDCPHLRTILLLGNDITNMKPLVKIQFTQLQQITIINNLINEIKGTERINFDQQIQSVKFNCSGQSAYQKGYPQNDMQEISRGCNNELLNLAGIYAKIKDTDYPINLYKIIKDIQNNRKYLKDSYYVSKVCQNIMNRKIDQ